MNFQKLEIVFNILHMNYLLGFRKMTLTIHLIFTSPAGIIFRPPFTIFCSCFVIIFLKKDIWFLLHRGQVCHPSPLSAPYCSQLQDYMSSTHFHTLVMVSYSWGASKLLGCMSHIPLAHSCSHPTGQPVSWLALSTLVPAPHLLRIQQRGQSVAPSFCGFIVKAN